MTKQILDEYYIITGETVMGGELVFLGIDRYSGGYPYWSDHVASAEHYKELPTPTQQDYMKACANIKVQLVQVVVLESWSAKDAQKAKLEEAKRKAVEEVERIEKELQVLWQDNNKQEIDK